MRIVIAGGGTGGHLYPGLAIAEAIRELYPSAQVLFVGGDRIESRVVPQEGWAFRRISSKGLPRRPNAAALGSLAANALGTAQALRLLREWRPDVVVATGGYVCAPVGVAARLLRVPLLVQEQNLTPGLASRLLSRWARCVSVSHPAAGARFGGARVEVTGVPVRHKALVGDRGRGRERWGLEERAVTVLVLGGSQGAMSLNRAISRMADLLMYERSLQLLHHTGPEHSVWVRETIGHREHIGPPLLRHVAVPFLDPVGDAYACAEIVVCRAGASTLAEVTAWGLPAVLVPYPHASEGHQERNAEILVEAGAAVRIDDSELGGTALVHAVQKLAADPGLREEMSAASRSLGRPGAAQAVARLAIEEAGSRRTAEGHR